jgi:hypothetical protein
MRRIPSRLSRLYQQEPTNMVSVLTIMRRRCFALGVADARAGKVPRPDYERWDPNRQWDYERGRQWALIAPRSIPLRKGGKLNPDAVKWYGNAIR